MAGACFRPDDALRGQPCSSDASCGSLTCSYGVCGGPQRCEAGAGVGDYCFVLMDDAWAAGASPTSLAVGPVNMDSLPDVVVGRQDGTVALLLNNGQGGFLPAVSSAPLGSPVRDLTVGRVDIAGWAEVVATTAAGGVWVLPLQPGSDERGSFDAAVAVAEGIDGPLRPQVGAFVDDIAGQADIAVLVRGGIDVREQTDHFSFSKPHEDTFVDDPTDIRAIGQSMDVVYVAWAGDARLKTYARNPTGDFGERMPIPTGTPPQRFLLEDVTDDDYADVLSAGIDGTVWLSRGKSVDLTKAARPERVYALGWQPAMLASAALDDDGDREFVIAGGPEGRGDVYLFDNDGDGVPIYGGGLGIRDAAAAAVTDLDVDGVAELVAVDAATGDVRVARRTVAPPPPGGETSSTGGVGMSTTQGSNTQGDSAETVDPSDPTLPGTTGMETGGGSCDLIVGPYCYTISDVYPSLPVGARMMFADVTGDFTVDMIVAGDYGIVVLPGLFGADHFRFSSGQAEEPPLRAIGHELAGLSRVQARWYQGVQGDPGVVLGRVVAVYGDALVEWNLADDSMPAVPLTNAHGLALGQFFLDGQGYPLFGDYADVAVLDESNLLLFQGPIEAGATSTGAVVGHDLAPYYDFNTALPMLAIGTDAGVELFPGVLPGDTVTSAGTSSLPLAPVLTLATDPMGWGLLATDGTMVASLLGDDTFFVTAEGLANPNEFRFADFDADFYFDTVVLDSMRTRTAAAAAYNTASNTFMLLGNPAPLGPEIADVGFLTDQSGQEARPPEIFLYFEDTEQGIGTVIGLQGSYL
ncbi:MAG: hypothetical protein U0168_18795 [Nannocystaceae bacterium]